MIVSGESGSSTALLRERNVGHQFGDYVPADVAQRRRQEHLFLCLFYKYTEYYHKLKAVDNKNKHDLGEFNKLMYILFLYRINIII